MSEKTLDRKTRARLAMLDHGTRDGATAQKVKRAMLDEGFTLSEIQEAARSMGEQ